MIDLMDSSSSGRQLQVSSSGRHKLILSVLLTVLWLAACGGTQKVEPRLYDVDRTTAAGQALDAWFSGDETAASAILETPPSSPEQAFVAAEIAYNRGDMEGAFDRYGYVVSRHPAHPFARYAAARIYMMRDAVLDFPERAASFIDATDTQKLDPLGRAYLAMVEQVVIFRTWDRSADTEPFNGSKIGFPDRWNITPALSPFRLTDFETIFAPETSASLQPKYLSPAFAVDSAENYETTTPFFPRGLSLNPPSPRDGIYYLETFATAEAPRDLWVYGNFTGRAKLIIDGVEVIDRREVDYQTGKRLRRIHLTAGTHRILVKLGVQRGYRDWFDLQFIPDGPVTRTGLEFEVGCLPARAVHTCHTGGASAGASVELLTEEMLPSALEPVFVPIDHLGTSEIKVGDLSLYLTMLGAFFSSDDGVFDAAWSSLAARHPEFSAGHALRGQQVQTLWQWPSRLRDATSLQELREAYRLDPDSLMYTLMLARRLKGSATDREVRELTEKAFKMAVDKGRPRAIIALESWAKYLEEQGYDEAAEASWRSALAAAPTDCDVVRAVQRFEQARNVFTAPDALMDQPERCPSIIEAYQNARHDMAEENLAQYAKYASRFPFSAEPQLRYANELERMKRSDEAQAVIDMALARVPEAQSLWSWKVDRAFAASGEEDALKLLKTAEEEVGTQAWIVWKRALLEQKIPLMQAMPDGMKAAMDAVSASKTRALSSDDAYYVIDFAARQYFPDGANITLTHTVIRVLTKNAIDRFAETQVPSDARILVVRTIKQDGTVEIPEETPGKQTLSMPGLAEGDFVELAFIQFKDSPYPSTSREGVRFFFRMEDISTLHSEYVIFGDRAEFILKNDPPKMEEIEVAGMKGVRFLATDNPRPRDERYSVSVEEYLPWIQMYRNGLTFDPLEGLRRMRLEQLTDSSKPSDALKKQASRWIASGAGELERVKSLFYAVSAWIPQPSLGDFTTDVSHAVITREGNSLTVLHAVLTEAGIPSDLYLVRSPYAPLDKHPAREPGHYNTPILRVEAEGKAYWLMTSGPDAMFGAVNTVYWGQELLCVTCTNDAVAALPTEGFIQNTERIEVKGEVDEHGDLTGTLSVTLLGTTAEPLRTGLRARADEANREKLMGAIAAQVLPGSVVNTYEIIDEKNPDAPLRIVMQVSRQGFARPTAGGMGVETRMFDEPIARVFAPMAERTVPMMISYTRHGEQHLSLTFARTPHVLSLTGTRDLKSKFGEFSRTVKVDGHTVMIDNSERLPVQRISVDEYPAFQRWAVEVEQNSPFVVVY